MKTLTETLMEEEARHSSDLCYKTASSYMFGAEAWDSNFGCNILTAEEAIANRDTPSSSSCGSALSSGSGCGSARDFTPFDYNPQSVAEVFKTERSFSSCGSALGGFRSDNQGVIFREVCDGLQERYDFSGHNNTSPHLNQDLKDTSKDFKKALGDSHHIDLGFNKDKKFW